MAHPGTPDPRLQETPSIAVVVPAFRSAETIARVIEGIPDFVRYVLVVDDQSPDDTSARVRPLLSRRVHLLRHRRNTGVGGAMLSGYAAALELGARVIVKMDGDDQMDPAQLRRLLRPILEGEADYAKGNRFLHSTALRRMPFIRRLGNTVLTFLVKFATGYWTIFDPCNGYTAIHAGVLRRINQQAIARDYFFEISLLLELRRLQAVVADVAMPARYGREISSLSVRRVFWTFPGRLTLGFLRRLRFQYFLHDFSAASLLILMGIPCLLFGLLFGTWHWWLSIQSGIPATTGTVLLAALPVILGVHFLVQALVLDVGSVPRYPVHPQLDESDPEPFPGGSLHTQARDYEVINA